MAKGVEDTAFYRWTAAASLNEVGGAPPTSAVAATSSTRDGRRQQRWPAA